MARTHTHTQICQIDLSLPQYARLSTAIREGYHHHWRLDNLPAAWMATNGRIRSYGGGFPVGFVGVDVAGRRTFVNNHFRLRVDYSRRLGNWFQVVQFTVEPYSIRHVDDGRPDACPAAGAPLDLSSQASHTPQPALAGEKILFTYDVIWNESPVEWKHRWEVYLTEDHMVPAGVHMYSIVNSLLVILLLLTLIAVRIVKSLRHDLTAYSVSSLQDIESDEVSQKLGWMLLHGDVFRPPRKYPLAFCVAIGTGVQLGTATLITLCVYTTGLLTPAHRGALVSWSCTIYSLCGVLAGYTSSRLYQTVMCRQQQQQQQPKETMDRCTVVTAAFYPAMILACYLMRCVHAAMNFPMAALSVALCVWGVTHVASVFGGAVWAAGHGPIHFPTATSEEIRPIPRPQKWSRPWISIVICGCLPFAAMCVEMFFTLTWLWRNAFFYEPVFCFITFVAAAVMAASAATVTVYVQFSLQNHQWWWFSFLCGGSCGVYVWLYSLHMVPEGVGLFTFVFVYAAEMLVISTGVTLVFGTLGFFASLTFARVIYRALAPQTTTEGGQPLLDMIPEVSTFDESGGRDGVTPALGHRP
jgi:transmembrane 9 superfamily protein 2/4